MTKQFPIHNILIKKHLYIIYCILFVTCLLFIFLLHEVQSHVAISKQISVILMNRPGAIAKACSVLSENLINLQAISVLEHTDHAVMRIIADNPTKASLLLEHEDFMVMEQDVITIKIDNAPGSLTRITQKLAMADINVSYAYAAATEEAGGALLVLRTDNLEKTEQMLSPFPSS